MSISAFPQFVIKTTKYCNLRCDYCYEFPYLADRARMSLPAIRTLLENIRRDVEDLRIERAEFIWHGGEPFLIPVEFYEQVGAVQQEVFGTGVPYANCAQTNLTVLTNRHIEFLKGDFFAQIGVSFDVYGDQRVDTKGRLRTEVILANLKKLIAHGINVAAIAVMARNTLPFIREIYRFYDDLDIKVRMLAYYRTAGSEQAERHGVTYDELVGAYKDLFEEWLASERATPVKPVADFVQYAILYVTQDRDHHFDRSADDRVFVIDVNGDVYNDVESYAPDFRYGNLFQSPLSEIVASEARRRSNTLSDERTRRFCHPCPYFGHCPGGFVANATLEQRKLLETRGCPVRDVLDHIIGVFERTDIRDFILTAHRAQPEEAPALSVA
jgi:uncharacterized protein